MGDNGRKPTVTGDNYKDLREKIMRELPVISIFFKGEEETPLPSCQHDRALNICLHILNKELSVTLTDKYSWSTQNIKLS